MAQISFSVFFDDQPSLGINHSIRASIVQIPPIVVLKIDIPQQVPMLSNPKLVIDVIRTAANA